jgi:hypothetical protein
MVTITTGTRTPRKSPALAAVGGVALALAIAAGVGAWQVEGRGERAATAVVPSEASRSREASDAPAHTFVSDQEMYGRWRAFAARVAADRATVSDQEMFQRLHVGSRPTDVLDTPHFQ